MFGKTWIGSPSGTVDDPTEMMMKRQYVEEDGRLVWFWYTKTGVIIKYVLFFGFFLLLTAWVVGGRTHARRRLRKGLTPLAYHSWLLSRREKAQLHPVRYGWPPQATYYPYAQAPQQQNGLGGYYNMQPVPPPVYDPNRPPVYESASKTESGQQQEGVYVPPAGPPPPPAVTR